MPSRVERFNYWTFVDINPIYSDLIRRHKFDPNYFRWLFDTGLASSYKAAFQKGNDQALIDFAHNNPFFLQYKWVIDALQIWILREDPRHNALIQELFLRSRRGEHDDAQLIQLIERDKLVFMRIKALQKEGYSLSGSASTRLYRNTKNESIYFKLATEFHVSESTIKEIYTKYSVLYRSEKKRVNLEYIASIRRMVNHRFGGNQKDRRQQFDTYVIAMKQLNDRGKLLMNPAHISILLNDSSRWWRGQQANYYRYGFNDKGFETFLQDCKILMRNGRIFLPYHSAIQWFMEAIYRGRRRVSLEEMYEMLSDLKINDLVPNAQQKD